MVVEPKEVTEDSSSFDLFCFPTIKAATTSVNGKTKVDVVKMHGSTQSKMLVVFL